MRKIVAFVAAAMLFFSGTANFAYADVTAVPNGTVVQPGTIAVIEEVNFASKTVVIAAGVLPYPFGVGVQGDLHRNAWVGYTSAADAVSAACQQAAERLTQDAFAGFSVTVVGHPNCGKASVAPQVPAPAPLGPPVAVSDCRPGIIPVMPGETLPAGHAAVVRELDWSTVVVGVYWTEGSPVALLAGSGYDGNPLHERAIWHQCNGQPWAWQNIDACNEVVEVWRGLLGITPRAVFLNGKPTVPNTCRLAA